MKITDEGYAFESTGRTVYANNGLVSINYRLDIAEGYDGRFEAKPLTDEEHIDGVSLAKSERVELADFMISLWERFKIVE